jgi:hypothetical protein
MVKALNTVVHERDLEQALAIVAGPLVAEASAPH